MPRGSTAFEAAQPVAMPVREAASESAREAPVAHPQRPGAESRDWSEINRLLFAEAWIGGHRFRRRVIERAAEAFNAPSLEIGIDMPRLVRLCLSREKAETMHRVLMSLLLLGVLAGFVQLADDETPGLLILTLAVAAIFNGARRAWLFATARDTYGSGAAAPASAPASAPESAPADEPPLPEWDACGLSPDGQNLLVYAGFTPFAFAGIPTGGWAVSVDVSRPASGFGAGGEVRAFAEQELWDRVEGALQDSRLPGMGLRELLFAAGTDASALPPARTFAGVAQPKVVLSEAQTAQLLRDRPNAVRRYLWTSVCTWGGELVVSTFWRCALHNNMLQVEMSRFVLPPPAKKYRRVETLAPGLATEWEAFVSGALLTPFALLAAPVLLLDRLHWVLAQRFGGTRKSKASAIKRNPLYDFGARRSLRVETMGDRFPHYFMKMDQQHTQHFIDRIVLETLVAFLEEHGIDTADLKETQTAIFNSGVIVQGGDITAQSLAVGAKAQARTGLVGRAAARGAKGGSVAA